MGFFGRLFGRDKAASGSVSDHQEIVEALEELAGASGGNAVQVVFERHAGALFRDQCPEVLGSLIARDAATFGPLKQWIPLAREHGIAVFGPVATPTTCSYPPGPPVSMAEQLGASEDSIEAKMDGLMPRSTSMMPFEQQVKAIVMDLGGYWKLGHMKNGIKPGLGEIEPVLWKRAYLVMSDPVLKILESLSRESDPMSATARELVGLVRDCRRIGIDGALDKHSQPGVPRRRGRPRPKKPDPVTSERVAARPAVDHGFLSHIRRMQQDAIDLANQQRHPEARVLLERAEQECRDANNDEALVAILHEKAITVSTGTNADPARALEVIEEAEQLCQVLGMWGELRRILQSKGAWYYKLGDEARARANHEQETRFLSEWLTAARKGNDPVDLVDALVANSTGKDRAERNQLLDEALAVAKRHRMPAAAKLQAMMAMYESVGL